MNSAGHQFRVEFPIRIPGHVDIQSTPRIRQSEITDTPTQWFLLVRLMPRHQKKQPPIHTDSHPDSTADAPSKLVKKGGHAGGVGVVTRHARRSWVVFFA
ncbi:hypothetical protein, partial [Bifidobacterium longum]|uniref:hypothetical protein n=1 Tax=Bifidobacterium longum TaxID=216816 RepID=UPI001EDEE488